jgi:diguanylate cyclase (GGDEF)-like protein/PAS domain S-box-containing protein
MSDPRNLGPARTALGRVIGEGRRTVDRFLGDLLDAIPDGLYVTDAERRIIFWNEAAERITGYPADDVLGTHCYDDILVHEDVHGTKLCTGACPLAECIEDGEARTVPEVLLKREDGARLPVYVKTQRFEVDGQVFGVEVFGALETVAGRDVARLVQEVSESAVTDALTGLFNRRYIDLALEQQFELYKRLGRRYGVIMIDVDGFKAINDGIGHLVGDEVLRFVAGELSDGTRKMDLLARWGGDEFVAICAVGEAAELERIGRRHTHMVGDSQLITDMEELIPVTVSAGGTLVLPTDHGPDDVLARADKAMYMAKRAGGNDFSLDA